MESLTVPEAQIALRGACAWLCIDPATPLTPLQVLWLKGRLASHAPLGPEEVVPLAAPLEAYARAFEPALVAVMQEILARLAPVVPEVFPEEGTAGE